MRYLSLDIETSGLDPHQHNILEFGAVLDDLSVQAPLSELPTFHCYVLPPSPAGYTGDPYALQMNQAILEEIAKRKQKGRYEGRVAPRFVYPSELIYPFASWAMQQGLTTKPVRPPVQDEDAVCAADEPSEIKFVAAGKNVAGFDLPFLRAQLPGFDKLRISHRVLDPAMLYFDPSTDSVPPDLATCLERAGLESTVTHLAVDDSLQVIRLLRHAYPLVDGVIQPRVVCV